MAALIGTGCESEKAFPSEEVLYQDQEATFRSSCSSLCDPGCYFHDYCCCEMDVDFQGDFMDIDFCKDWDFDPIDNNTCYVYGCGQFGLGEKQSLVQGINNVCLIGGMAFHIRNNSTSDTLHIEIACGPGCADLVSYSIAPGEMYRFGLDSGCRHYDCN